MIRAENKLIMMVIRAKQSSEKISSAQVANFPIWAKACNPVAKTFFLETNNKTREISLNFALAGVQPQSMTFFRDSIFSYTIQSARPIEGMHESCFCFAVMPKD